MIFIARLVHYAFSLYALGLVAYVICSWIAHPTAHAARFWLARWYEPVLAPIRRILPAPRVGDIAVDISPIMLFLGLVLFRQLVLSLLVPPF